MATKTGVESLINGTGISGTLSRMSKADKKFQNNRDLYRDVLDNGDQALIDAPITLAGTTATDICKTQLADDMLLQATTPADLVKEIGGARIEIDNLMGEFAKICPEVMLPMALDTASYALDYMKLMLYNIGPETRMVKKGKDADKHWKLRILDKFPARKYDNTRYNFAELSGNIDVAGRTVTAPLNVLL